MRIHNIFRLAVLWLGFGTCLAFFSSSSRIAYGASVSQPLKVGFVMVGPVCDHGWNYAHDLGRRYLESNLKGKVETTYAENIPEGGEVERVLEKMIAQGNKLIFTTSYGYLEPALRVAKRHPDVTFMQCQRTVSAAAKNVGTYFARQYEGYYVAGFVAGKATKKNKLAYIAGHPVPEVLNCINAFQMGASSADPKVRTQVIWLNTWSDPALEAEAARGAIEQGADVVATQLSSAETVLKTTEKAGAFGIGCSADLSSLAPKAWLTGQVFNWGPLYLRLTQSVLNHSWQQGDFMYGMKEGTVTVGPYGQHVTAAVKAQADSLKKQIENGGLLIFKGPINDRDGTLRVKAGETLSPKSLRETNWVVSGIDGVLAKK